MKIQVDLEKIIKNSDPIYTFNEIMEQIDLYKYFAEKGSKTGRPRFDSVKLLKIILFAFMENGYATVGNIEKLFKSRGKKKGYHCYCKNDYYSYLQYAFNRRSLEPLRPFQN